MVAKEYALVKPMVGDITFIPSGVIVKVNCFDKSNIHNLVVEVIHRNLCRVVPGRARGVCKDDIPFALGFGTSHPDEPVKKE